MKKSTAKELQRAEASWTFLTNHSHVLLVLSRHPDVRIRDIAIAVGITERAVQRILEELETGGYILVEKTGRRNRYTVNPRMQLRHPVEAHCTVGGLVHFVHGGRR
jgi:DNA-binding IclR family transcriptional regulator